MTEVDRAREVLAACSTERGRPSRHGSILGRGLAEMAEASGGPILRERCAGCAFRTGTYANRLAATVSDALFCLTGPDDFMCHHGLVEGEPTRPCAGYRAALAASRETMLAAMERVTARMDAAAGPDPVQADVDAWLAEVDPDNRLDDYQRGHLWNRRQLKDQAND